MSAVYIVAPVVVALAFVLGAVAGVRWTTDVWFSFLDDEMGEDWADQLIERFKKWKL